MILFSWIACVEPIELDLPSRTEKVVVYGWITSEDKPHEIKVSKTLGFNDQQEYPAITGAEVYVINRINQRFVFSEVGDGGLYHSDSTELTAVVGDAYQLHIETTDGMHIVSTWQEIKEAPPIVHTEVEFVADPEEVDLEPGEPNYYVSGFIRDQLDIRNYYRWQIFVNDSLRNIPEDLVLFDDLFTDGNIFRFDASNVLFTPSDKVVVRHMSLGQETYYYYVQLKDLTGTDLVGPIFRSFALEGNLTEINQGEEVLGVFGTSDVRYVEVQSAN